MHLGGKAPVLKGACLYDYLGRGPPFFWGGSLSPPIGTTFSVFLTNPPLWGIVHGKFQDEVSSKSINKNNNCPNNFIAQWGVEAAINHLQRAEMGLSLR